MTELDTRSCPRQHLHILNDHVLDPLSRAETLVERERAEVVAERDAFSAFGARLDDVAPVSERPRIRPLRDGVADAERDRTTDVRRAYRRTVMSVPHFEDVYDESLVDNARAEFGPDLAELFNPRSTVTLTRRNRDLLLGAVDATVRDRDEFAETLESEADSLRRARSELTSLLDTLDTSIVPAWYRDRFDERVESILTARQRTLYGRSLPATVDGHTFCASLYGAETWTYPALTAVARLLGSVARREE